MTLSFTKKQLRYYTMTTTADFREILEIRNGKTLHQKSIEHLTKKMCEFVDESSPPTTESTVVSIKLL